jgi:hypothetical protein
MFCRAPKISTATITLLAVVQLVGHLPGGARAAGPGPARSRQELANRAFRLTVACEDGHVKAVLRDQTASIIVADGPVVYRAVFRNNGQASSVNTLKDPTFAVEGDRLTVRGYLANLAVEHTFRLPSDQPWLEEKVTVRNAAGSPIELGDLEIGMTRRVTDRQGKVLPGLERDRVVAVPFRHLATDAAGFYHDFMLAEVASKPGQVFQMNSDQRPVYSPSRHRCSEGWAWMHGAHALGVFSFNQVNLIFSVLSQTPGEEGMSLRLGGAVMIEGEPAALTRLTPGQSVDLGIIRYQVVRGGPTEAIYAFRDFLDEKGCRFPKDFDPPVHWEQLYDMNGAWSDRIHQFTKARIEQQAALGQAFSCEAMYLDPGWDSDFGTFVWGEWWLGPRKEFVDEMKSKYGLKVSLHCPLATWMSHTVTWGANAYTWFPAAARRQTDVLVSPLCVPALRGGCRNLALLPGAKSAASSEYENGNHPLHRIAHLNDGLYGNATSWIPVRMPAWAEIDLGAPYQISKVVVGNDHGGQFQDRAATELNVLAATEYGPASSAPSWRKVAEYRGQGVQTEEVFSFAPVAARWVRIDLGKGNGPLDPRLDEIEVYEASPAAAGEARAFQEGVGRRLRKTVPVAAANPRICLGSRQYLDEAERRLLANCADGVAFLMFDGNWWNGGCSDPAHGHPVPYRMEDHIRANFDLCRRIHAKYPKVLIEMHDMLAGGSSIRATPIYYKYGLPGSYDDNWGFELMWNILDDVTSKRALMLYYANLGCNVPMYLHINLSQDNEHLLGLWWYASTCRHLGIGGTHQNKSILAAQQDAMRYYHRFERFFKRGDFYGLDEEIHLHVLPDEKSFMVNVFNLTDRARKIHGTLDLRKTGLAGSISYAASKPWAKVDGGILTISLDMPAWAANVADVHAQP